MASKYASNCSQPSKGSTGPPKPAPSTSATRTSPPPRFGYRPCPHSLPWRPSPGQTGVPNETCTIWTPSRARERSTSKQPTWPLRPQAYEWHPICSITHLTIKNGENNSPTKLANSQTRPNA